MRSTGIIAAVCLALCGCWRPYHIQNFGSSYDAAFLAQRQRVGKPPAEAAVGLDSQEAAITSANYRFGLVPKGEQVQDQPLLYVAPPTRDRPPPLAPSVPKE
jgi:hypothetical protein